MKISINGDWQIVQDGESLAAILPEFSEERPFSVALNGEFVARSAYPQTQLKTGDELDIVYPIGGG